MSKYTAQQIYALGQFIIANQSAFPTMRIGNGIRHLEYNAQRGLDSASYAFFEKMGTSVDKAVEAVSAHQYQLAHPKPTHAMPTSAPPEAPKRRVAVFVSCFVCKRDVAVPEDRADQIAFCSEVCQRKQQQTIKSAESELMKFLQLFESKIYDCDYNTGLMTAWMRERGKSITEDNLMQCYFSLKDKLLKPLTPLDVQKMTSQELEARLKIDPSLGGVDTREVRKFTSKTGGVN